MNIKQKLLKLYHIVSDAIRNGIDVRDIFVFGGLGILTYGLYLYSPWISFVVCGILLMMIGIFWGGRVR